ncbi:hypothetical protein SGLAU_21620 [Streptomyces glaucescens]|uniref:Uncharacterized protein n=1 Tax=Streptomyces glaucescens TaxID=1907 RepID=A0A089X8L9_STRGA|nr:hypothetical protein SGLAU_21620 [Streptomyces glaucescens]
MRQNARRPRRPAHRLLERHAFGHEFDRGFGDGARYEARAPASGIR